MKIKIVLPILFLFCSLQARSQSIPNGGFENWYWLGGWVLVPNGWHANNSQLTYFVQQDSDAYAGNFAARVITSGDLNTGFIVTMHPVALKLEAKSFINVTDNAFVSIVVYSGGNPVDYGNLAISSNMLTWTALTIPISQNALTADSVFIQVTGGTQSGTYLVIDDLILDYSTGINEWVGANDFELFPNPVSENGQVHIPISIEGFSHLSVIDATGRKIMEDNVQDKKTFHISDWHLSKGIYFIQLSQKNKLVRSKFIVE